MCVCVCVCVCHCGPSGSNSPPVKQLFVSEQEEKQLLSLSDITSASRHEAALCNVGVTLLQTVKNKLSDSPPPTCVTQLA